MNRAVAAVLSAAFLSAAAFAQAPDAPPPGPGMQPGTGMQPGRGMHGGPRMGMPMRGRVPAPVTNAPFSAKFTVQSQHTAPGPDGLVTQQSTTESVYRDSLGRTREDITLPAPPPRAPKPADSAASTPPVAAAPAPPRTMTVIYDPVANTVTRLLPDRKVAMVETVPADFFKRALQHESREAAGPQPARDNATVTSLGSKTFAGVSATGTRTTRTMHQRPDAPADATAATPANTPAPAAPTMTHEQWFSPDLKLEISSSETSPHGSHSKTLASLTRAEPDAALFKVPEGYTVRNGPPHGGPGGFHRRGPRPDGTPDAPPPPPAM